MFENNCGGMMVKMVVEYSVGEVTTGPRIQEKAYHTQTIRLPMEARNIKVWFEALRFAWTYAYVKKWDRKDNSWHTPTTMELFKYDTPPMRRFVVSGAMYQEALTEIYNNNDELIIGGY